MFKFRRHRSHELTVHADELQVADQFLYNGCTLEVLDINKNNERTIVRLGSSHPAERCRTQQVNLFNDMLMTVTR